MATIDNASVLRTAYEAFNARDVDKLASCATADAMETLVPFDEKQGFRESWEVWAQAFPDGKIEVKNLIAQGDYAFAEVVGRGTHTGTLKGPTGDVQATGRRLEIPMVEVYRFRGGKIVEGRCYFDAFSFFKQLGLGAPEMGASTAGATTSSPARH
ncbi:MAG TPA: ester cyclase [Anaeromyxobacter sp.]|nr:ester cyclase [Anaeromyxobacter sp.]